MCAITAAARGRSVLVLEKSNKVGKKILMSGGGRCNFTNLYVEPDNFLSANPHFCKSALSRYTQWDFIELVNKHGIKYHEKTLGQLFCDNSSKDILNMLTSECDQAGVEILTHADVEVISKDQSFELKGKIKDNFFLLTCENLVVATGGLSIPSLGGSDFGYRIGEQFGHKVLPLRAGLVPFTFTDRFKLLSEKLSGVSVPVTITSGNQSFSENILFSHRGLSGPAVLQISSYWREGETVIVDLLPDIDAGDYLLSSKSGRPKIRLRTVLSEYLPKNLVVELETLWWPELAELALAEINDSQLRQLASRFNAWQLKPAGTEGYRTAEVTLGGIDTHELSSKTMMSNKVDGLYIIGEVVDVTGHLGGFNFQWAWSSG
ncbi:MAG: NAD(P)/FAD-dependent oxidoreductase, partial [Gammaproteobacteria bacterium]|nr:NAD(P)/FAD-dependent oxidoreductase [Gammaproteobacteria bacterium]